MLSAGRASRGHRVLRDQLDRSCIGIVLCIVEGAGRCSRPDKRRFYEMARGSTTESAAIFDIMQPRGLVGAESYAQARLLERVVPILTRMSGTTRDA